MSSPVGDLRARITAALMPLNAEVLQWLPEDAVNPPLIAVGMASIGPSQKAPTALLTLGVEVTLVGHRGDSADAQAGVDDLQWSIWQALNAIANGWAVTARPRELTIAGKGYPAVIYLLESATPCA